MKKDTRRKLLKRLTVIAAVSATGYVAPKVLRIKPAFSHHKEGHCAGSAGCV